VKQQYASVLLTLTCFLALGIGAEGQRQHEGVVNVPFEFVAAGKTLPAGTYTVGRVSENGLDGLIISNYENRSGVFMLPNHFESYPAANVQVTFKQLGGTHFLSRIETADGAYSITVPRPATAVAGVKQREGMSAASGTQ
jgi:hypothetical protein